MEINKTFTKSKGRKMVKNINLLGPSRWKAKQGRQIIMEDLATIVNITRTETWNQSSQNRDKWLELNYIGMRLI